MVRLSSTGLAAKVIDSNAVVTSKSDQAVHDNAADNGCMGTLVCKKKQSLVEQLSAVRREKEARIDETDYYFENGFRKVYPYYHTFATFCKGMCNDYCSLCLRLFFNLTENATVICGKLRSELALFKPAAPQRQMQ